MAKICESCNGSGQVSFFKGESRFLLSYEECPECAGLGAILVDNDVDNDVEHEERVDKKWLDDDCNGRCQ